MDYFSYEVIAKEKVRSFQEEGLRNQDVYRSGSPKPGFLRGLPKLVLVLLGILGILELLAH